MSSNKKDIYKKEIFTVSKDEYCLIIKKTLTKKQQKKLKKKTTEKKKNIIDRN